MIIVGGAYTESVLVPSYSNRQGGSGLRGALAIGDNCDLLVTALAEGEEVADLYLRERTRAVRRAGPVSFHYLSPISTPTIVGRNTEVSSPLIADSESVLIIGMVEDVQRDVRAKMLVIDPQSPRGFDLADFAHVADHTVLSVNAREAAALVGQSVDPATDAMTILQSTGYAGVVVRAGARGSFVAEGKHVIPIAARPTQTVWSLGSGDTYSATFALAWSNGHSIVESAEIASNATAWWCGQREPRVPSEILDGSRTFEEQLGRSNQNLIQPTYSPKVYLGGPFFNVAEHMLIDSVLNTLNSLGATVFSPFHHVGPGGDEVAKQDIDGLADCDSMLALLDHYDPGTLFEAGWAAAQGIPIVGYRSQRSDEGDKMLVGLGAEVHGDLTSALYRVVWAAQGAHVMAGRYDVVPPLAAGSTP